MKTWQLSRPLGSPGLKRGQTGARYGLPMNPLLLRLCIEKRSIAPAVISGTMLLIWCSATAEWG